MDVEFIFGSEIEKLAETVGHFVSSFDAANYEISMKRAPQEEAKEGDDPRASRLTKNAENVNYNFEDESIKSSEHFLFQVASAHATTVSKRLVRERGSTATPAWMTQQAQKIVSDAPKGLIKDIKILNA